MQPDKLDETLDDPANKKFYAIWGIEQEIAGDLEQAVNWYERWSTKADAARAAGNADQEAACNTLAQFWEELLVKSVADIAQLKKEMDSSTEPLVKEFVAKDLTIFTRYREALDRLSPDESRSGKAILGALVPLMETETPEPPAAPKAEKPAKGNPFRNGPSA